MYVEMKPKELHYNFTRITNIFESLNRLKFIKFKEEENATLTFGIPYSLFIANCNVAVE